MLSVWQIAQSAFGVAWDGRDARLSVAPPEGDQVFVLATPQGWATAEWNESSSELTLTGQAGEMRIERLRFRGEDVAIESATIATGQTATLNVTG